MNLELIAARAPALFAATLVAILFLQSGLDKVFDWRGNLGWLNEHFSKTFLAPMVPMLLATITVLELAAGLLAAAGIIYFLFASSMTLVFASSLVAAAAIAALFFGQRVAKDYPGAAVLIPYAILVGLLMYVSNPFIGS